MADQDQAVDTDYSGRPYRPPTVEEMLQASLEHPPFDQMVDLPDGRRAVYGGHGKYYLRGDDGWPDWDQPVHIRGLSRGRPKRGDLIIQLDQPK